MKRTIFFILLIAGLLLAGTHVFGWSGGPGMRGGQDCGQRASQRLSDEERQQRHEIKQQRMAVILDLNEDQQQQLHSLHEEHQRQQQVLHSDIKASREQLQGVARDNDSDEVRISAAAQKHAELKTRMMLEDIKHHQQIAAVLTPEQQQKFAQLRELKEDNSCSKRGQFRQCRSGDCTPGDGAGRCCGQGPRS